ncbi:MAG: sigma-70 family RNA polymerase sigma factor [Patescibacteria group bacterium]|nr:sigma-70 family RNA polymerase sigma factor [Patescibacteria group bacterium]
MVLLARRKKEDGQSAPKPYEAGSERSACNAYFREISGPLLTPEQEVALNARVRQGDTAARSRFITANLLFVVKIARDYEGLGLPLEDLIGEGNIGLIKGVERFRSGMGAKFTTYGAWWIKQAIIRALNNHSRTIRLPIQTHAICVEIRMAERVLYAELGREPTSQEIADRLGRKVKRIEHIVTMSQTPDSIDREIDGIDQTYKLGDSIPDEQAPIPGHEEFDGDLWKIVKRLMRRILSERELTILRQRFGLNDGGTCLTLEELGKKFRLSRERIRQIQKEALNKVRTAYRRRFESGLTEHLVSQHQ